MLEGEEGPGYSAGGDWGLVCGYAWRGVEMMMVGGCRGSSGEEGREGGGEGDLQSGHLGDDEFHPHLLEGVLADDAVGVGCCDVGLAHVCCGGCVG